MSAPLPEPAEIVVCGACRLPVGPFRGPTGGVLDVLDCACGRIGASTRAEVEANGTALCGERTRSIACWEDIGEQCRRQQLCKGCAAAWLPDLSRWSVFWCGGCKRLVRAVNGLLGRTALPMGRHTLMNGPPPPPDGRVAPEVELAVDLLAGREERGGAGVEGSPPSPAERLVEALRLLQTIDSPLRVHQAIEIERNLEIVEGREWAGDRPDPHEDVPVADYLDIARAFSDGPAPALLRLAEVVALHERGSVV